MTKKSRILFCCVTYHNLPKMDMWCPDVAFHVSLLNWNQGCHVIWRRTCLFGLTMSNSVLRLWILNQLFVSINQFGISGSEWLRTASINVGSSLKVDSKCLICNTGSQQPSIETASTGNFRDILYYTGKSLRPNSFGMEPLCSENLGVKQQHVLCHHGGHIFVDPQKWFGGQLTLRSEGLLCDGLSGMQGNAIEIVMSYGILLGK